MLWQLRNRNDSQCRELADRHYNRQSVGAPGFVPPGRCCVFYCETVTGRAFWVTSWPFAEFTQHAWGGAWVCSAFRNEGAALSSDLITQAVSATRHVFGAPPALGFITFVDRGKTRAKRDPGYCYKMAGWRPCGRTKTRRLHALQLLPADMPDPVAPVGAQYDIWGG